MSVANNLFKRHVFKSVDKLFLRIKFVDDVLSDSDIPLDERNLILSELRAMNHDLSDIKAAFHDFNM